MSHIPAGCAKSSFDDVRYAKSRIRLNVAGRNVKKFHLAYESI